MKGIYMITSFKCAGLIHRIVRVALCLLCLASTASAMLTYEQRQLWSQSVTFNRAGIASYFTDIFSSKGYGSYAAGHLIDFLTYSVRLKEPVAFTYRVLELFSNRMQEAVWTNPYLFADLCSSFVTSLSGLMQQMQEERLKAVKKTIYTALLNGFDQLKSDPDLFLSELSRDVVCIADTHRSVQIHSLIAQIVMNMTSKLVWSLQEQEHAWEIALHIADLLHELYMHRLIPDLPTLNHLYWTLLYRFIYSLEMSEETVLPATYQRMKEDLATGQSILFTLEDDSVQAGLTMSRAQCFTHALIGCETRALCEMRSVRTH